jgi:hypothetical protein
MERDDFHWIFSLLGRRQSIRNYEVWNLLILTQWVIDALGSSETTVNYYEFPFSMSSEMTVNYYESSLSMSSEMTVNYFVSYIRGLVPFI